MHAFKGGCQQLGGLPALPFLRYLPSSPYPAMSVCFVCFFAHVRERCLATHRHKKKKRSELSGAPSFLPILVLRGWYT
jgi:hypothetical protein